MIYNNDKLLKTLFKIFMIRKILKDYYKNKIIIQLYNIKYHFNLNIKIDIWIKIKVFMIIYNKIKEFLIVIVIKPLCPK